MESLEWYAIRATGVVAYLLLYLAALTGLYSTVQKKRKKKINGILHFHEVLSDWSLIMTCGHLGILLIDSYFPFKLSEVLIPFASGYETISMAMGTIGFYFFILTLLTSKFRKKIGYQRWQKLHALNPILYILVTLHGLMSGSDFPGTILAALNLVPIIFMAGMLLSSKNKLTEV
ncbi:ferric reductase-like transmembrane domain-containing protein [Neobacillus cucumis]|uniref:ferric reductase-like transmembrane domain-containing protein n=1 Tax=Neobacillus cucumis TaxID=1740721 RepID=UPI0018DFC27C|nr:ferric reductase-like transmembrane domain-containing protein [Neobacillus cucumis]MBI0577287.1 ferric reductase-like transmembrane domain-containing protein [Neobacillus cucumis]